MLLKSILLVAIGLLAPVLAWSQPTPGTYKLMSFDIEIEGVKTIEYFGKSPQGYIVLTKSLFISVLSAEGRKAGRTQEEKAALLDTIIAYTGPYRIEGRKFIVDVESSWNQAWSGKTQSRTWVVDGSRLTLVTDPAPYSRDPSKTATAKLTFEKIE